MLCILFFKTFFIHPTFYKREIHEFLTTPCVIDFVGAISNAKLKNKIFNTGAQVSKSFRVIKMFHNPLV